MEKYFDLLAKLLPESEDIFFLGVAEDFDVVWKDASLPIGVTELRSAGGFSTGDCVVQRSEYPDGRTLLTQELISSSGVVIGLLGVIVSSDTQSDIHEVVLKIAGCIETNIELNAELDEMALELSERYEELNLAYVSNEDTEESSGWDPLNSLVSECLQYMDVDLAAISVDYQATPFISFSNRVDVADSSELFADIAPKMLARIKSTNESVVVNSSREWAEAGLTGEPQKLICCPVHDGAGRVLGMVLTVQFKSGRDVSNSDRKLLEATARKAGKIVQANFDAVSGMINQSLFERHLGEVLTLSDHNGKPSSILKIDIDQLDVVNINHGFEAGDKLIVDVGRLLEESVGPNDIVASAGSGKFYILLSGSVVVQARILGASILKRINSLDVEWKREKIPARASIGIASISGSLNEKQTIALVGFACDKAKQSGGQSLYICESDSDYARIILEESMWVDRIRQAIKHDEFVLFSQPIVSCDPEANENHCEILIRLLDADNQVISPDRFLPIAEKYKLMSEIDRWVLSRSLKEIQAAGPSAVKSGFQYSINVSGQSVANPDFLQFVLGEFLRFKVPHHAICFEVTETEAIGEITAAVRFVDVLRSAGCKVALDDFGTGLSSYEYLRELPVDYLKIDGSFVRHMTTDPISRAIVESVSTVAQLMNLKVVAEYIETQEIYEAITALGIDYGQGYWLGEPKRFHDQLQDAKELSWLAVHSPQSL